MGNATAQSANPSPLPRLGPVRTINTRTLTVGYVEEGPPDGEAVLLLHGFPYDVHSYVEVIPRLVNSGLRVITPYLRGHGPTKSRGSTAAVSGEQAALGTDVVELLDALQIDQAVCAGFDWGGRAACVAAALWPERCAGLVSVNGYLIQDLAAAREPLPPRLEAGFWYFWYFATDRGAAGLAADRRGVAEVIWAKNSPAWEFDDEMLDRAAAAFYNKDYVDVVLHSYRHRLGLAPGHPTYVDIQARLDTMPPITVPAVTLDGTRDGNFPATDGEAGAAHFTGPRVHLQVPGAGHNLPQEAPDVFAGAVMEVRTIAHNALAHAEEAVNGDGTAGRSA
jgi:pimeloyl-ACP methyl ester carboxylesterase